MPRDVLTPEFAETGAVRSMGAGTMRRVEIPGIGIVEFPEEMSDADISAAAAKLHGQTNTQTASAEQFTPAPRMTRLEGDPSAAGFGRNLVSGAMDAVTNLPRTIKGLTKINPLELPGQIASGIGERVQSYADDPLSTIYDDPLSFLGDAATMTGVGAAASAPLRTGARGVASAALKAGPAARTVADVGIGAAKGALESKAFGGSAIRGAVRGGTERFARRGTTPAAPPSAAPSVLDDLPQGYDRYMPNVSAPTAPAPAAAAPRLPAEFGTDVAAGPSVSGAAGQSFADDAFSRYTSKGMAQPPKSTDVQKLIDELVQMESAPQSPKLLPKRAFSLEAGPYADDPRAPMSFLRAQRKYDGPEGLDRIISEGTRSPLSKAGRSMLTPEEEAKLLRALSDAEGLDSVVPTPNTGRPKSRRLYNGGRTYGIRKGDRFTTDTWGTE